MKLTVKTLKGSLFDIRVQPSDTIMAVKKNIEEVHGKDIYPWGQQLLIHNGKVLKDESTLEENKVSEDGFLVVMLSKSKTSGADGASSTTQPSATAPAPCPAPSNPPAQAPVLTNVTTGTERATTEVPADARGQAASNLVVGSDIEPVVQQLMDMGGGNWGKDPVLHALCAAYNNPKHAVEYLYSGIPATAEVAVPIGNISSAQASGQDTMESTTAGASLLSGVPNSAPLDMFPQGTPSFGTRAGDRSLEFLRHDQQPMLQELGKQIPQLLRLIQEHHAEFLQLINEPVEGIEGDLFDQPEEEMPHTISLTPAEQEAIAQIEAMGFDRAHAIEAFLACDRNEELAVTYLLEDADDEE